MDKSTDSGKGGRTSDASVEHSRRRRLPAVFQNPASVLTLGVFLLVAVILLGNEAVIREQAEVQTHNAVLQADTLGISLRDQIGTELAALESSLRLASLVARQDGMQIAAVRIARMIAARSGPPAAFALLDGKGRDIWKSGTFVLDPDLVNEHLAAFSNHTGTPYIAPARYQAETGVWGVYMSLPVVDANGELSGLVLAVLDGVRFKNIYDAMNLGRNGLLQLIRNDGTAILQVAQGDLSAGQRVDDNAWSALRSEAGNACRSSDAVVQIDGIDRIGSYCRISGYPLVAGIGLGTAALMESLAVQARHHRFVAVLLVSILLGGTLVLRVLIARQQRTQNELRRSEARFKALNALSADWYWETDAESRITHISEGFTRTSGRAVSEVTGHRRWELPFMTPVGSNWSEHQAMLTRGTPFFNLVIRFVSADGAVSYGSITGEPLYDDDGALRGYHGTGKDVTAETILRQRLQMQHDVARILGQERDVSTALRAVLETICRTMEWSWGAHRHFDLETELLTCLEYWVSRDINAEAFVALALKPKRGNPLDGTIARAVAKDELMWFADQSPLSTRRRAVAEAAGLNAAVVVPVHRAGGGGHALEFFSARVEAPDQLLRNTLEAIAREVGQFMDRADVQANHEKLERERRHLLEMHRLQLDRMPIACLIQDGEFRTVYCNPAAERIFGYSRDELLGRDTLQLMVPAADRAVVQERRARVRAGGEIVAGTNENMTKDGRKIICEWSLTPLPDESGAFAGALVVAQDVTERTSMMAALEESEARYRRIFVDAPLPMWVADLPVPNFLAVNDAALAKYGYSRDEFLAMTTRDLQVPEDREAFDADMISRDVTILRRLSRRHVTRDGQVLDMMVTSQPFQFGGRPARLVIVNDVTQALRAQRALADSEARFRAVFEQASVGIGVRAISEEPRWLSVNRKLCEMLGYSEDELLRMTSVDITPEEDRAETQQYNAKLRASELRSYSRNKRYRRKDGRIIWVDLSVAVVASPDGVPQYLVSVVHDISDSVASRELLRQSEERYRQIFALTPMPMFMRSEKTLRFLETNDAFLETYGYTRDEISSLTVADLQVPDERGQFQEGLAAAGRVVERLKKKHVRRNGEIFDAEVFSYPVTIGAEQLRLSLVRDMTDQIHSEQMLRESERRVSLALEASGGALFDWNVETTEVYLSEHWNVILGGDSRETNTTFPELARLLHPDDQDAQRRATVTLLKTGRTPLHTEFRIRNFRGDWIWIESRGSVTERTDDGRALRIRGTNVDITARKEVEMALRERDARLRESEIEIRKLNADLERRVEQRTQALAAANRELESFSYSVSHDLRAPLRTIDGFSQIVLDEYAAALDDTGRGYLERVRAGSQRMARLIDDLLELARVTRRDLLVGRCDLTAMVHEIAQELQNAEPERNVSITVAAGMHAVADQGLMRVVLDNLLRNAWKFTSREDQALIEAGSTETGGETVFFVRDNGVGFDMTYVNKLFGAFQRLHSEAEFRGTGIGLALVQRVIRRHGGQVWAEAEPGRGATFYFTVPQSGAEEAAAPRVKAAI